MTASEDQLSAYDYALPPELIAQSPAERREASRLLVLHRTSGTIEHRRFSDLPDLLQSGDLLVMNNTKVVPARLKGFRKRTAGRWEGLFLRDQGDGLWRLIGQTRGRLEEGETLVVPGPSVQGPLELDLLERQPDGEWLVRRRDPRPTWTVLTDYGQVPLPPYIGRETSNPADLERYQTVYASQPGAVAAPTAGLHFTPEVLDRCREKGVETAFVTLHVGLGTFRPVSAENLSEHVMHSEWADISTETVEAVRAARARGGRIVAVGTTSVRSLESASKSGGIEPWTGETKLFIRPPYQFQSVDAMVTNFHLPKSTLLMLVSAFAGRDKVLSAYAEAIRERYRFFSYGDAMFIVD